MVVTDEEAVALDERAAFTRARQRQAADVWGLDPATALVAVSPFLGQSRAAIVAAVLDAQAKVRPTPCAEVHGTITITRAGDVVTLCGAPVCREPATISATAPPCGRCAQVRALIGADDWISDSPLWAAWRDGLIRVERYERAVA